MGDDTRDFVLVGGGVTSAAALEALLREGIAGSRITLIASEPWLPYHRPPLSKTYLLGTKPRERLFVKPEAFYGDHGVNVMLGVLVTGMNTPTRCLTLSSGQSLTYRTLLLATGCLPHTLSVPGNDLPGVFTLRTLDDADRIRAWLPRTRHAAVIGGGFIGMELASVFAQRGLDTTILHRGHALFDKLGVPEASRFFEQYYRDRGVAIRFQDEVVALEGQDAVATLRTATGAVLPAELVAVGIGAIPDISFLKGSGIALGNGVTVNEYLETSLPDVYAAGDIADFFDPLYGRHRRIEHWDTARRHGTIAGQNMAGRRTAVAGVSTFFSDIFDLSFEYFGDATGTDMIVTRGSFVEKSVSVFFLMKNSVRAAFTMGRPRERTRVLALIEQQIRLPTPTILADIRQPLLPGS